MCNKYLRYQKSESDKSLSDTLSDLGDFVGIALLYSPNWAKIVRVKDGKFDCMQDGKFDENELPSVFEAKIFNEDIELRWVNKDGEVGVSTTLNEVGNGDSNHPIRLSDERSKHLLYGKLQNNGKMENGYVTIFDEKVGRIKVPVDNDFVFSEGNLAFECYEYYLLDEKYGNARVIDTRFIGIVHYDIGGN
jgi:CRISPR-associated protein (TIGR03984 family)